MKKTFNWGYLLAVSDIQSIIVMTGSLVMFRCSGKCNTKAEITGSSMSTTILKED